MAAADSQTVAKNELLPPAENTTTTNDKPAAQDATPGKKSGTPKKRSIREIIMLVCRIFMLILPPFELYIGVTYSEKCPMDWHIPHYLVVAGAVRLVLIVIIIIMAVLALYTVIKPSENQSIVGLIGRFCGVCGLSVISLILSLFLFGWFIAGCVWIFSAWSKVQYENPKGDNYCHPTLYRFAYWLLIISIFYGFLSCLFSSTGIMQNKQKKKRDGAIPVPTSEP